MSHKVKAQIILSCASGPICSYEALKEATQSMPTLATELGIAGCVTDRDIRSYSPPLLPSPPLTLISPRARDNQLIKNIVNIFKSFDDTASFSTLYHDKWIKSRTF